MRNVAVAEWIVSRFTDQDRAASMIGDLVEMKPQKGNLWFWLSLAGIVLTLTWRRPIAFLAAVWAGLWGYGALAWAERRIHVPDHHPWIILLSVLSTIVPILWIVLLYTAIRYGFRDNLTQLTFVWAGVVTVVMYYWWQPVVLVVCVVLIIFVVVASILSKQRRRAAAAILVNILVGYATWSLTDYAGSHYLRYVLSGPMGGGELRAPPSAIWTMFYMYLLTVWITTMTCSRTHRWWVQNKPLSSDVG